MSPRARAPVEHGSFLEELGRHTRGRTQVEQGPKHVRHGNRAEFDALRFSRHVAVMKEDSLRHPETPLRPIGRQRQIHLSRERVREVVEHEGGLVREDPLLLRPEPEGRKVLVLASGKMYDSVDAAPNAGHPPVL